MALLPLLKCGSGLVLQDHAIGTINYAGHTKIYSANFCTVRSCLNANSSVQVWLVQRAY